MLGDTYVPPFRSPFLNFWGLNTIFWGYFFWSTNTETIFWGTKPSRIRFFWPQIPFLPRSFRVQFSAARALPHHVFRPSTPHPPGLQLAGITRLWLVSLNRDRDCLVSHCIMGSCDQWEFPPFCRPQWLSFCTATVTGKCLPLGLCKGTVKESNAVCSNYANPAYGVATICHQVRWLRWGHPSLFHTATSLLIWYKMFCVRDISYRLIWMEFINMFSVHAHSGTHSRFKLINYRGFNIQPFCSDVCGDHGRPQTLAEMCRNMGICYGFRSMATRVKYPGFM